MTLGISYVFFKILGGKLARGCQKIYPFAHARRLIAVFCTPRLGISWSMAAMLCDVVVVGCTRLRPRSMVLAMLTMKKELHGQLHEFLFLCISMVMVLRLAALRAAGVPLKLYPLQSYRHPPRDVINDQSLKTGGIPIKSVARTV